MKKNFSYRGILGICFSLFIASCQEDTHEIVKQQEPLAAQTAVATVPTKKSSGGRRSDPQGFIIDIDPATGEYRSGYGTGITFGTSFIHPTTVDHTGQTDGEPAGGFDFVAFQLYPTLYTSISNDRFVLIQPTFPNGASIDQIHQYLDAWKNYWDHYGQANGLTPPTPVGSTSGGGGIIEIRGKVIRDHNSPTNASVVDESYEYSPPVVTPTNPPSGGTGNGYLILGTLQKNGYTLKMFGPSGSVTDGQVSKIEATNASGATVTARVLSIDYLLNYQGDQYHLTGSVKIGSTIIPIDDYILTAW